ncbi:hypothetical protein [Bacillus alkalicellulosilyticus]|uniref:hypothetical protein n=1 Tax=Alkalihalobacterium alkalicellulosilyticum TaxID=1912214 RepID=UPI000998C8C5|nr:hypothetical protein [Bacillus alkalicellulosilyticus]
MSVELLGWKKKLETERNDLIKKREIIEGRLQQKKMMWSILQKLSESERGPLYNETEDAVHKYEQELESFTEANQLKLTEIEAILSVIDKQVSS